MTFLHIQRISTVKKLAILLIVSSCLTKCRGSQKLFNRHVGSRMTSIYAEADFPGRSRMECAAGCADDVSCKSANFHVVSGTCELSSKNVGDSLYVTPSDGWEIINWNAGSPGWHVFGMAEYYYTADAKTWHQAKEHCESMSAYLADVLNAEENAFLSNFIVSNNASPDFWLGGNDLDVEGEWKWTSGQAIVGYDQWDSGEPNNQHDEDCLKNGVVTGWLDIGCHYQIPSFCKRSL